MLLQSIVGASASLDFFAKNRQGDPIKNVTFICYQTGEEYYEPSGHLHIDELETGNYQFTIFADLYQNKNLSITIAEESITQNIVLEEEIILQDTIIIKHAQKSHLGDIQNDKIIGSQKHEVINVEELDASKATNDPVECAKM